MDKQGSDSLTLRFTKDPELKLDEIEFVNSATGEHIKNKIPTFNHNWCALCHVLVYYKREDEPKQGSTKSARRGRQFKGEPFFFTGDRSTPAKTVFNALDQSGKKVKWCGKYFGMPAEERKKSRLHEILRHTQPQPGHYQIQYNSELLSSKNVTILFQKTSVERVQLKELEDALLERWSKKAGQLSQRVPKKHSSEPIQHPPKSFSPANRPALPAEFKPAMPSAEAAILATISLDQLKHYLVACLPDEPVHFEGDKYTWLTEDAGDALATRLLDAPVEIMLGVFSKAHAQLPDWARERIGRAIWNREDHQHTLAGLIARSPMPVVLSWQKDCSEHFPPEATGLVVLHLIIRIYAGERPELGLTRCSVLPWMVRLLENWATFSSARKFAIKYMAAFYLADEGSEMGWLRRHGTKQDVDQFVEIMRAQNIWLDRLWSWLE